MIPKHVKKTLKKENTAEAQSVKTRGPNPNPTAQAQSKRCLPLSTKTQKILLKMSPFRHPFWVSFWSLFHKSDPRGQGHTPKCPQDTNMDPNGTQMEPKGPQSAQKTANYTSGVSKWSPKATQSAKEAPQGPAKCHKDTHRCQQQAQLDTNNQ